MLVRRLSQSKFDGIWNSCKRAKPRSCGLSGPNMAYFSKEVSLKEMMEHIYGTKNIENHENRPNMFVKELELYVTYLTNQINDSLADHSPTN